MIALDEWIVALLDTVSQDSSGESVRVEIDEVALTLPVEVRFGGIGGLAASAPRGRYATGFDLPHHVLTLAFTTRSAG